MHASGFFHGGIGSVMKSLGLRHHSKKSYSPLTADDDDGHVKRRARKGFVAIYVGEERKRYEVPVKHLADHALQELIRRSIDDDQMMEPKIDGPIVLACSSESFDRLLKLVKKKQKGN